MAVIRTSRLAHLEQRPSHTALESAMTVRLGLVLLRTTTRELVVKPTVQMVNGGIHLLHVTPDVSV